MKKKYEINVNEQNIEKYIKKRTITGVEEVVYTEPIDNPLTSRKYIVYLDGDYFDKIGFCLAKEKDEFDAHICIAQEYLDLKKRTRPQYRDEWSEYFKPEFVETLKSEFEEPRQGFRTFPGHRKLQAEDANIKTVDEYVQFHINQYEKEINERKQKCKIITFRDTVAYLTLKHKDILEANPTIQEGLNGLHEMIAKHEERFSLNKDNSENRVYIVIGGGMFTYCEEDNGINLYEQSGSFNQEPREIRRQVANAVVDEFNARGLTNNATAYSGRNSCWLDWTKEQPEKIKWINAWMDFVELVKEKEV
ncbi:hypothetical protein HOK51_06775 [Candidatus Woesearchaeota archaeon]|jgi:hypothetical protein|nr:hypothetical protein [Candidatus Woesearchaeota archaeon]MBT6519526.1 hypothetical protein [Candidatus Woesearchaeota archaeon]MBT7367729.1 hypothetical protein [Candidatus Woesearchaeota archaeon]